MALALDPTDFIYEALCEEFDEENVRYDSYRGGGGSYDFPVIWGDGRIAPSTGASELLASLPAAGVDLVFARPDIADRSQRWIEQNRGSILGRTTKGDRREAVGAIRVDMFTGCYAQRGKGTLRVTGSRAPEKTMSDARTSIECIVGWIAGCGRDGGASRNEVLGTRAGSLVPCPIQYEQAAYPRVRTVRTCVRDGACGRRGQMLKALERAIVEQGGDPGELQRIREARKVLSEYRRLREKLGLASVEDKRQDQEAKTERVRG